ncbi:sigma-70 family RNA polymerase sigma factor [Luteipulveratus sp. YIM 133132]|uniref:sigma-70 family RNA polymerase sigma factor n=1 Tax=Luteipulveratus flavus TaxID=3031728 RepID=UPI0023B00DF2|nr:sigma-70 family RNA polymerase sigma factor [Luteipulveratus sp. YIM 133132]MDE9365728.1 sigma-70 family RNA polymerase sigma factor [Luteipulveratus sp. YIM 133132]
MFSGTPSGSQSEDLEVRTERLLQAAVSATDPQRAAQYRDEVVLLNRGLALRLAHRLGHRGIDADDLHQVALLGLVLAVRRYRPGAGPGFTAFAVPTITGELKRHFRDHGWAVRPPRALQEAHRDIRTAREDLEHSLRREPTTPELADAMGAPVSTIRDALLVESQYRSVSLDSPLGPASAVSLSDVLPAAHGEDDLERVDALVTLRPALQRLSARDRTIVRLRFVDNLTQRQIARQIGVSQMQVSRLLGAIQRRLARELADPAPARAS